jgi:putative tricarboxylic transport membrane protein
MPKSLQAACAAAFALLLDAGDALAAATGEKTPVNLNQGSPSSKVAGGSAGGSDHILLGMIAKAIGVPPTKVSYVAFAGGGPAQAAILGAQVKAGISGWSEFAEQIKSGRMRALATTGETRTAPDVPTLKESGADVVTSNWRGVFAPPGIRPDAREALVKLMTEIHALPAWKELLEARGWDDAFLTGDAFAQFLERDRAQTEAVLKEVGLA